MRKILFSGFLFLSLLALGACSSTSPEAAKPTAQSKTFTTGAIPDQDPEKLQRLYSKLSKYLEAELKVPVAYKPVTDYTAAVTAFKVGDLDMVWFGGLTGVQARLQVPGAEAPGFTLYSTFIPNASGEQSRNVLTGYLTANSDAGPDYGKLTLLTLPGLWRNLYAPHGYRFDIPTRFPTVFERHKKEEGCRIAYLACERSNEPAPASAPWAERRSDDAKH